ncbi:MAG TPA: Hsp20 family protein [Candidatus Acidoferrum sp.]|nr:Hsp20 family protein [Candidatus Acidoferrum sp.]
MAEKSTAVQIGKEPVSIKPFSMRTLVDRMDSVFDSISKRAYELFDNEGRVFGHDLEHWLKAESELLHPVRFELNETDDALQVKAEVPGFTEKELEVRAEPRRLIIAGKHESTKDVKKGKSVYSEISSNQLLRVIDLPADVESEKIEATLKNGVLELNMPKTAKARSVKIQPKAA